MIALLTLRRYRWLLHFRINISLFYINIRLALEDPWLCQPSHSKFIFNSSVEISSSILLPFIRLLSLMYTKYTYSLYSVVIKWQIESEKFLNEYIICIRNGNTIYSINKLVSKQMNLIHSQFNTCALVKSKLNGKWMKSLTIVFSVVLKTPYFFLKFDFFQLKGRIF